MIRPIVTLLLCLGGLATDAVADTLTAARLIRPDTVLGPQDIATIETTIPGALDGSVDVVGLEAKSTLYPGHPIRPEHVGPAALVERNQQVLLAYEKGGLTIYAEARALSRGAVGDIVRVMNLASRRTISGRVRADGTVAVGIGAE